MNLSDVLRSSLRTGWSMSMFGARQTGTLLGALATMRRPSSASEAFDAVARAAEGDLDGTLGELFRTGWRWQRAAADTLFDLAEPAVDTLRSVTSTTMVRPALRAGRISSEILDAATPERLALLWRELANKLAAFEEFQYAHYTLDLLDGDVEVGAAAARAGRLASSRRLWALEGLGYACAEAAWRGDRPPRGLFAGRRLDGVPRESWLPLHTGLGLSLARRELHRFDSSRRPDDVAAALRRFAETADSNARTGYWQAIYESLGLVLRQLDPAALETVDRELLATDPERSALLWHGAGRGLYFLASQTWPGSLPRALALARREPPNALARRNMLAGLGWAFTLVNFCHPEVIEGCLENHFRGWNRDDEDAFAHGISSAFLFWFEANGADRNERRLRVVYDHRPTANEQLRALWGRLVTQPCETALDGHAAQVEDARLGEIFRDVGPTSAPPEEE